MHDVQVSPRNIHTTSSEFRAGNPLPSKIVLINHDTERIPPILNSNPGNKFSYLVIW
jgi:hypothetical protein